MKKTIYGFVITALVMANALAACNSRDETASTKNNSSEMMKEMNHDEGGMDHGNSTGKKPAESAGFLAQRNSRTAALIDAYDQTKSGLDVNDKTKTAEGAKAILAAFEQFDATNLNERHRNEYKEIYESAKEHAEHIVKSELDHQKEHFESLTTDMKDLLALVNNDNQ